MGHKIDPAVISEGLKPDHDTFPLPNIQILPRTKDVMQRIPVNLWGGVRLKLSKLPEKFLPFFLFLSFFFSLSLSALPPACDG